MNKMYIIAVVVLLLSSVALADFNPSSFSYNDIDACCNAADKCGGHCVVSHDRTFAGPNVRIIRYDDVYYRFEDPVIGSTRLSIVVPTGENYDSKDNYEQYGGSYGTNDDDAVFSIEDQGKVVSESGTVALGYANEQQDIVQTSEAVCLASGEYYCNGGCRSSPCPSTSEPDLLPAEDLPVQVDDIPDTTTTIYDLGGGNVLYTRATSSGLEYYDSEEDEWIVMSTAMMRGLPPTLVRYDLSEYDVESAETPVASEATPAATETTPAASETDQSTTKPDSYDDDAETWTYLADVQSQIVDLCPNNVCPAAGTNAEFDALLADRAEIYDALGSDVFADQRPGETAEEYFIRIANEKNGVDAVSGAAPQVDTPPAATTATTTTTTPVTDSAASWDELADLQEKIAAGTATDADIARRNEIRDALLGLDGASDIVYAKPADMTWDEYWRSIADQKAAAEGNTGTPGGQTPPPVVTPPPAVTTQTAQEQCIADGNNWCGGGCYEESCAEAYDTCLEEYGTEYACMNLKPETEPWMTEAQQKQVTDLCQGDDPAVRSSCSDFVDCVTDADAVAGCINTLKHDIGVVRGTEPPQESTLPEQYCEQTTGMVWCGSGCYETRCPTDVEETCASASDADTRAACGGLSSCIGSDSDDPLHVQGCNDAVRRAAYAAGHDETLSEQVIGYFAEYDALDLSILDRWWDEPERWRSNYQEWVNSIVAEGSNDFGALFLGGDVYPSYVCMKNNFGGAIGVLGQITTGITGFLTGSWGHNGVWGRDTSVDLNNSVLCPTGACVRMNPERIDYGSDAALIPGMKQYFYKLPWSVITPECPSSQQHECGEYTCCDSEWKFTFKYTEEGDAQSCLHDLTEQFTLDYGHNFYMTGSNMYTWWANTKATEICIQFVGDPTPSDALVSGYGPSNADLFTKTVLDNTDNYLYEGPDSGSSDTPDSAPPTSAGGSGDPFSTGGITMD